MNNAYLQILTTLVRVLVVWLMGALASHLSKPAYNLVNDIITQLGGQEALILAVVGFLATAGFSIWVKLKSHVNLTTALKLPKGSTVDDVKMNAPSVVSALTNPQPKT